MCKHDIAMKQTFRFRALRCKRMCCVALFRRSKTHFQVQKTDEKRLRKSSWRMIDVKMQNLDPRVFRHTFAHHDKEAIRVRAWALRPCGARCCCDAHSC